MSIKGLLIYGTSDDSANTLPAAGLQHFLDSAAGSVQKLFLWLKIPDGLPITLWQWPRRGRRRRNKRSRTYDSTSTNDFQAKSRRQGDRLRPAGRQRRCSKAARSRLRKV